MHSTAWGSRRAALAHRPQRGRLTCCATHEQKVHVNFRLRRYKTDWGQTVVLVGNHEELGSWDLNRGRYMTWKDDHAWVANVTLTLDGHSAAHAISYKYAVVTLNDGQIKSVTWQDGKNYNIHCPKHKHQVFLSVADSWDQSNSDIKDLPAATASMEVEGSTASDAELVPPEADAELQALAATAATEATATAPSPAPDSAASLLPMEADLAAVVGDTASAVAASDVVAMPPAVAATAVTPASTVPEVQDAGDGAVVERLGGIAEAWVHHSSNGNGKHSAAAEGTDAASAQAAANAALNGHANGAHAGHTPAASVRSPALAASDTAGATVRPKPKPLPRAPLVAGPSEEQAAINWVPMPLLVRKPHGKFAGESTDAALQGATAGSSGARTAGPANSQPQPV